MTDVPHPKIGDDLPATTKYLHYQAPRTKGHTRKEHTPPGISKQPTMVKQTDDQRRAAEIISEINKLATELARLNTSTPVPNKRRDPHKSLKVGQRVLITRGDDYHGRWGVLSKRHLKSDYWDIELEATDEFPQIKIYKTPSGFRVYRPTAQKDRKQNKTN